MEGEMVPTTAARYFRLLAHLARYTLSRELAFRGNFLVKVSVEALWLGIMIAFYRTVFARTSNVAGWSEADYFFFVGCYFALNGLVEMLFFENCNEFAELVRTETWISSCCGRLTSSSWSRCGALTGAPPRIF